MRNNIVDIAGGTFVVTAISYATGIAYYNSFFRNINANPNLFSVSLEKILFEGGRNLLDLAFVPACVLVIATLCFSALNSVLLHHNKTHLQNYITKIKRSAIVVSIKKFSWAYAFIALSVFTSWAFNSGMKAGAKSAENTSCTRAKILSEGKTITGCMIYKDGTEVWLMTFSESQKVLFSIPVEKYSSMTVFP
jgi:hypothetical protein